MCWPSGRGILSDCARHKEAALSYPLPRAAALLLLAGAVAGCANGPAAPPASSADCVGYFQWYDATAATMSTPTGRADRMPIPPALQWPVAMIQQGHCLTSSADLAGMATAGGAPIRDSGPAIAPISLHAGIVTNSADEAAAVAFFRENGAAVRTVGAAGLGRRIYLGPFATQGALDSARDLAVRAGFASPYPARF